MSGDRLRDRARGRRRRLLAVVLLPWLALAVPPAVRAGRLETPQPGGQVRSNRAAPPQQVPSPSPVPAPSPVPSPVPAPPRTSGIPALTGPVVDEAGVLDAAERRALENLSYDVKRTTGAEIAVLAVRTTAPLDEFTYGMKVVGAWKLGSAEKDDGLLLLVAVDDRRARFFAGYGLEGILPDGRLGAILDRFVVPRFRGGDYAGGIQSGMAEIARILKTEYRGDGAAPPPRRPVPISGWVILLWALFGLLLTSMIFGRRRRRFHPIFWGGGFGGPMSGGFGGGFGGRGGGFGGGGGGFGGGGAGRSW